MACHFCILRMHAYCGKALQLVMIDACRCQTMAPLSSPLTLSDAGIYTCQATVPSSLLSAPISQPNSSNAVIINPMCKIFAYNYY